MMRALIALALAASLAACSGTEDRFRAFGEASFEAVEATSGAVLDGSLRYICQTARVGPIEDFFNTDELRADRKGVCDAFAAKKKAAAQ